MIGRNATAAELKELVHTFSDDDVKLLITLTKKRLQYRKEDLQEVIDRLSILGRVKRVRDNG